jgi:hypothetical protein
LASTASTSSRERALWASDAAEAAAVVDQVGVLGQIGAAPERNDEAVGLEKHDVPAAGWRRVPAEPLLIETPRALQIGYAESDGGQSLFHA